jgi:hypothetical protein
VTNLEMTVNGVPQDDNLESGSAAAGLYLSYPLFIRGRDPETGDSLLKYGTCSQ